MIHFAESDGQCATVAPVGHLRDDHIQTPPAKFARMNSQTAFPGSAVPRGVHGGNGEAPQSKQASAEVGVTPKTLDWSRDKPTLRVKPERNPSKPSAPQSSEKYDKYYHRRG